MAKRKKPDPLKPSLDVLVKLGSVIIHAEEAVSPEGRPVDIQEFQQLLKEPEVAGWLKAMADMAFLPRMRGPGGTKPL